MTKYTPPLDDYKFNVDMYNTFERIGYPDQLSLLADLKHWCEDNVGEFKQDWFYTPIVPFWRIFYFKNEEDCMAFKLKFKTA